MDGSLCRCRALAADRRGSVPPGEEFRAWSEICAGLCGQRRGSRRMIVLPAVDLRDGACVQLVGGAYEREAVRLSDPVGVARAWLDAGFRSLHLVDLDAATGRGSNIGI